MRKPIIAGNWKMNNTIEEGKKLIAELKPLVEKNSCDIVLCVPFTFLNEAAKVLAGSNIRLGAQNVHFADNGAYTGEISAKMLKETGAEYAIIGHSERRQYFGETDETVNLRTIQAIKWGITPIVCVGESLKERETGKTEDVLKEQIEKALKNIDDITKLVIAYEPIWAIGTGKTATAEQANQTIGYIRSVIAQLINKDAADKVRIQYGGSMNAKNASELMAQPEIDGGLIGGASLSAQDFSKVVNY